MGLLDRPNLGWRIAALALCGVAMGLHAPAPAMADDVKAKAIPLKSIDHPGVIDFQQEILPLLRDNCLACHNAKRSKADLILETPADILRGGENGPAAIPGNGKGSLLLQAAAHQADPSMPPKDNKVQAADLTGEQLSLIRLWIDQGAKGEVRANAPIQWSAPAAEVQPIYAVALTPDGRYAAAGRANHLDLYDVALQRHAGTLVDPALVRSGLYGPAGAAHRGLVESLAFSPDGTRLASGSFGEVKIWHRDLPAVQFALAAPTLGTKAGTPIMACAAGGNWAAIAYAGLPIQVFDAGTGKWAKAIDASTSPVRAIAFSPDATKVAVASADGGLRISAIAEGELVGQTVAPGAINAIAWVSNGAQLAAAGPDGIIWIWTTPQRRGEPWTITRELKGHRGAVTALASIGRGAELYSGGEDGIVRRWELAGGQIVRQYPQGGPIAALAVRPDGKAIASAGPNSPARLWDADKATVIAELKGNIWATRDYAARDRAQKLAAADVAYFTSIVDKAEASRKAAADRVKAASDAKTAADAKAAELQTARDRAAALKAEAEKPPATMPAGSAPDPKAKQRADEAAKALAAAETQLAAAVLVRNNADTEFRLATDAVAKNADELSAAKSSLGAAQVEAKSTTDAASAAKDDLGDRVVARLAFSADGSVLAASASDRSIDLFSADTGVPLEAVQAPHPGINTLAFAGPKLLVATAEESDLVTLGGPWSLERTIGTADAASPLEDRVTAVAFSPDGKLLATGAGQPSRNGQIKLWDAATGNFVRECKDAHSDSVLSLEFSPDGKLLASAAADRFAKLFDVSSGKFVKAFEGHSDQVTGVTWKADGRMLATSGADNQVKFWDVISGERKSNATGFAKEVDAVRYLGLSDQAVAASGDGQIRIVNEAGAAVKSIPGPRDFFHAAAVTPDGNLLAVGGESGVLWLWREPFTAPPLSFGPSSSGSAAPH
jgi:WD40 repeat protein